MDYTIDDSDKMINRWDGIGLLNGIDNLSHRFILSFFFETTLQYWIELEDKKLLPFECSETIFFPMIRKLFSLNKLTPKYFLPHHNLDDYNTYDFFIPFSGSIRERISYEKEIQNYCEELPLSYLLTIIDDLEKSIRLFIPLLFLNFHSFHQYVTNDYILSYNYKNNKSEDQEALFLRTYCEGFNIDNLLVKWKISKEQIIYTRKIYGTKLTEDNHPVSDPIVSTTST